MNENSKKRISRLTECYFCKLSNLATFAAEVISMKKNKSNKIINDGAFYIRTMPLIQMAYNLLKQQMHKRYANKMTVM